MTPGALLRSSTLTRSMLFGLFAKAAGSLTLLVGLPIIAASLSPADYRSFLLTLSIGALTGLSIGSANTVAIRSVSEAMSNGNDEAAEVAVGEAFGLLLLVSFFTAAIMSVAIFLFFRDAGLPMIVGTLLIGVNGTLMIGDVIRLSERRDYISSLWQVAGSLLLLLSLLALSRFGLISVTLVYYAVPVITQLMIFSHIVYRSRLRLVPRFSYGKFLRSWLESLPVLLNGIAEYLKIYGGAC